MSEAKQESASLISGTMLDVGAPGAPLIITVMPMRVRHFPKFVKLAAQLIAYGARQGLTAENFAEQWSAKLMPVLHELLGGELGAIIKECVKEPIDELPWWASGPILSAWLLESFGAEEKVRPLVLAIERLLERMIGTKPDLWSVVSKHWSEAVMLTRQSLTTSFPSSGDSSNAPSAS